MNSGNKKLMKSFVILCVKQSLDFHEEDIIERIFEILWDTIPDVQIYVIFLIFK